jgi:hypothetical protein
MVAPKASTRRRHERLELSVPATVKVGEEIVPASTRDISLSGLFVFTEAQFREGSEIDIVLMLPKELGLPASDMVCCHGRIVRAQSSGGKCGVGAEIERFQAFPLA